MTLAAPLVAVIGGGPAGLAAALASSRIRQRVVLFDSGTYRNARAEHMHNVFGFDGATPADFRATIRNEIAAYGLTDFVDDYTVKTAKRLADGRFELDGRWTVDKVILATGVRDIGPSIPGYAELWGVKIHHCAFCHGREERDKTGAVLTLASFSKGGLLFQHITSRLSLLLNGVPAPTSTDGSPQGALFAAFKERGGVIHPHKIARLEDKPTGGLIVHFEADSGAEPLPLDFLVHAPDCDSSSDLADQLGCETLPREEGGGLRVNMFRETTVPGVMAAGDLTEPMKAVITASLGGSIAAAGVGHSLAKAALGLAA